MAAGAGKASGSTFRINDPELAEIVLFHELDYHLAVLGIVALQAQRHRFGDRQNGGEADQRREHAVDYQPVTFICDKNHLSFALIYQPGKFINYGIA